MVASFIAQNLLTWEIWSVKVSWWGPYWIESHTVMKMYWQQMNINFLNSLSIETTYIKLKAFTVLDKLWRNRKVLWVIFVFETMTLWRNVFVKTKTNRWKWKLVWKCIFVENFIKVDSEITLIQMFYPNKPIILTQMSNCVICLYF